LEFVEPPAQGIQVAPDPGKPRAIGRAVEIAQKPNIEIDFIPIAARPGLRGRVRDARPQDVAHVANRGPDGRIEPQQVVLACDLRELADVAIVVVGRHDHVRVAHQGGTTHHLESRLLEEASRLVGHVGIVMPIVNHRPRPRDALDDVAMIEQHVPPQPDPPPVARGKFVATQQVTQQPFRVGQLTELRITASAFGRIHFVVADVRLGKRKQLGGAGVHGVEIREGQIARGAEHIGKTRNIRPAQLFAGLSAVVWCRISR
jgi:hypothetical protein